MHSNNAYYLRAVTAEKELEIAMNKGRALFAENAQLTRNHVYALKVIESMGTTLQSRRHRLATWLGRLLKAPEMAPVDLAAMLKGIRAALDVLPLPAAGPAPTPPASSPDADPATQPAPQPEVIARETGQIRVVGGRDA